MIKLETLLLNSTNGEEKMFIVRIQHTNPECRSYRFPFSLVRTEVICRHPSQKIGNEFDVGNSFCAIKKLNSVLQDISHKGVERIDAGEDLLDVKLPTQNWEEIESAIQRHFCMDIRN